MFPKPGDKVRIRTGSFKDMTGVVIAVDETRRIVQVQLSIYGRSVTVEVDQDDIVTFA